MKTINLGELRTYMCKNTEFYCPASGCPFQKPCSDIHKHDWFKKPLQNIESFIYIMAFRKDRKSSNKDIPGESN